MIVNGIRDDRGGLSIIEWLVISIAAVFVILGTYGRSLGDTANSRLATVLSLTKHGTWYIDRPPGERPNYFEERTIDKVLVKGRLLSSKPPMLPLMMTGEYWLLNKVFGWDLEHRRDRAPIIRTLSMTLIGLSYVVVIVFFAKTLLLFVTDETTRAVALFSLAFGTQLWGYSTHINNHVPAAAMVVISLYLTLTLGRGKKTPKAWRFFFFGLAGGLVPTLDMPAGVFVLIAGLYLLNKFPKQTLTWALLGASIPLATHLAITVSVTGSPLPVQMRGELYMYEAAYWRNPRGIDALNETKATYLFHILVGRSGLFSLFPILLSGVAASLRALYKKDMALRGPILAGALGFLVLTLYYVVGTDNYGGEAYGFRWYIVAMPVLLMMGAPLLATVRARWKWIFISLMVGVSFYSAWECSVHPWGANQQWTCRFLGTSY